MFIVAIFLAELLSIQSMHCTFVISLFELYVLCLKRCISISLRIEQLGCKVIKGFQCSSTLSEYEKVLEMEIIRTKTNKMRK